MSYRLDATTGANNSLINAYRNGIKLADSIHRLSSGVTVNSASDDASGMTIANALRIQSLTLGQSMKNANDTIGILNVAEGEISKQTKLLDMMKVKATQAAQAGQTSQSRDKLQEEVNTLMEQLDAISEGASYNGISLLSGQFTNKKFQVGLGVSDNVKVSISSTSSDKLGQTRFETTANITAAGVLGITFKNIEGISDLTLGTFTISSSATASLGVVAEAINRYSSDLGGVRANAQVLTTGSKTIVSGSLSGLTINGISIGDIKEIKARDDDGGLVGAINRFTSQTGVVASTDSRGHLELSSKDGRVIQISASGSSTIGSILGIGKNSHSNYDFNGGRLTLTRMGGSDIEFSVAGTDAVKSSFSDVAQTSVSLRQIGARASADVVSAMGFNANKNALSIGKTQGAGLTTLKGAIASLDIINSSLKGLHEIVLGIGSTHRHLESAIGKIAIEQVNILSAESTIRDLDFASESAEFTKYKILSQVGSFAMSKAFASQVNTLKLLQM